MQRRSKIKKTMLTVNVGVFVLLAFSNSFAWTSSQKLVPEYWNNKVILSSNATAIPEVMPKLSAFKALDGLEPRLLKKALYGYIFAENSSKKVKKPYLVVIDYVITSDKPRLWIFNLQTQQLVARLRVAHAANSGSYNAVHFSNKVNSDMSSLGVVVTGKPYYGHYGEGLHLHGLQKGINDNVYRRNVMIHPWVYVDDRHVEEHGESGKTWGCLGLNPKYSLRVVELLKNGSVIDSFRS